MTYSRSQQRLFPLLNGSVCYCWRLLSVRTMPMFVCDMYVRQRKRDCPNTNTFRRMSHQVSVNVNILSFPNAIFQGPAFSNKKSYSSFGTSDTYVYTRYLHYNISVLSNLQKDPFSRFFRLQNTPIFKKTSTFSA